jgi:3-oxoacyl-[acyl-carrier protein] reductase
VKKKTALITGGATGLGRRTAIQLAEQGYQLAINYRNSRQEAIELAEQIQKKFGDHILLIQGDVANQLDCSRLVEQVLAACSTIDVVIHNAGPYIHERKKMTDYSF